MECFVSESGTSALPETAMRRGTDLMARQVALVHLYYEVYALC